MSNTENEEQIKQLDGFSAFLESEQIPAKEIPFQIIEDEPQALDIPTGEVAGQLLSVTFSLIASKKGDHWNLSAQEAEQAGNAYGDVLDKYFPDSIGNMGAEITALLVTGMLITPRLMEDAKNKPVDIQENNEKSGNLGGFDSSIRGVENGD